MASLVAPFQFKEILSRPASRPLQDNPTASHPESETDSFRFFQLPELVILKILKDYVPATDKAEALSSIHQFKPYIALKNLWFQPAFELFQAMGSVKSGWYVDCRNLYRVFYFSVNYSDVTVTFYEFGLKLKSKRIPVQWKKYDAPVKTALSWIHPSSTLTLVNDVLIYKYETVPTCKSIFFWIFPSHQVIRWSLDRHLHPLINNRCSLLNPPFHPHALLLTLQEDKTLLLQCLIPSNVHSGDGCGNIYRIVSPLCFLLCAEMGHTLPVPYSKIRECTCEKGPHSVHPKNKVSYVDVQNESASVIETNFYDDTYCVCLMNQLFGNR